MSAGYIQLAAIGQQDAYLTGSPQVTYFSGVYRRHTPFVLEAYDIPFQDQRVVYGKNNICRIPNKGDLVRGMTLKMALPALYDSGNFWAWPTVPVTPHFIVNGSTSVSSTLTDTAPSTGDLDQWFTGVFDTYVSYSAQLNTWIFQNCSNVEVNGLSGVFWGLDPKNFSSKTAYGNLVYTVSTTRTGDFTLEQSGWIRTPAVPPPNPLTGMFINLNQPLPLTGSSFINFKNTNSFGPYWVNIEQSSAYYTITPQGRISFGSVGSYVLMAGFAVDSGSVQSVSYGSTSTEDGQPLNPVNFQYKLDFRVSPDPSSPAVIPITVTDITQKYYFYVQTTGVGLNLGTYFSLIRANEIYKINQTAALPSTDSIVPFYGNVNQPINKDLILNSSSEFSFTRLGQYLLSGVLSVESGYVSNVAIWESDNLIYNYEMTMQGRDPTFAFSMPIIASDAAYKYHINVATTETTSLTTDSFFVINQTGVLTSQTPQVILPQNGLLFQSNVSSITTPLDLAQNFTSNGASLVMSVNSNGTLSFSNTGVYMMTAVFQTDEQIISVSFGPNTYPVSLRLLPPYTVSVPLYVTDTAQSYPILINTYSTTMTSNTFISVQYLASNKFTEEVQTQNFSYYDSVGTWAIKTAELKIGGQTIETITGEYIELWNDLNVPYENQPGLKLLTGKGDTSVIYPPGRTYYVNLPFYFFGNSELSLPLVALERQDVEVHITFRDFSELTTAVVPSPTLDATIITEYVYLSDSEINWFRRSSLDYIITQIQYQTFDLLANFQNSIFNIEFKNPIRELFFVIQPVTNGPYDYSNNGLLSMGMSFNGEDVFATDTTDTIYLGSLEPFNHYQNFPSRDFYTYSFTTAADSPKPFGQINFSRIKQVLLTLNTSPYYIPKQFRIMAKSYNVLRVSDGMAGLMFNI